MTDIFARNIQIIRNLRHMTQAELSEKTGISQKQISRYENANQIPGGLAIMEIAKALDVPAGELFKE